MRFWREFAEVALVVTMIVVGGCAFLFGLIAICLRWGGGG